MQSQLPKQYLQVDSRTVLEHTLLRLQQVSEIRATVVALDEDDAHWSAVAAALQQQHHPVLRCRGGRERLHSVSNALDALRSSQPDLHNDDWILVHDAARPAVRVADINRLLQVIAEDAVGGLLALPVADTLKRADAHGQRVAETVDRRHLWQAQTPQVFRLHALQHALQSAVAENWPVTDEASALELAGHQPRLVAGSPDNIKLTWPRDLGLMTAILQEQQKEALMEQA